MLRYIKFIPIIILSIIFVTSMIHMKVGHSMLGVLSRSIEGAFLFHDVGEVLVSYFCIAFLIIFPFVNEKKIFQRLCCLLCCYLLFQVEFKNLLIIILDSNPYIPYSNIFIQLLLMTSFIFVKEFKPFALKINLVIAFFVSLSVYHASQLWQKSEYGMTIHGWL